MKHMCFRLAPFLAPFCLAGCGAALSDSDAAAKAAESCATMPHGTEITARFPGGSVACNFTNLDYAIDGRRQTAGLVSAIAVWGDLASSERCAARATARSAFAAGSTPGVILRGSYSGAATSLDGDGRFTLRTFLDGELQEESTDPVEVLGVNGTGGVDGIMRFQTTKAFDAVELAVGELGEDQSLELYEFCSNAP